MNSHAQLESMQADLQLSLPAVLHLSGWLFRITYSQAFKAIHFMTQSLCCSMLSLC